MKKCPHCGAVLRDGTVSICEVCKMDLARDEVNPINVQDEYYNDVLPDDQNKQEEKPKSNAPIKVALLLFGMGLVIATCVVMMTMLG